MNNLILNIEVHSGNIISLKENNKTLKLYCDNKSFYKIKLDNYAGGPLLGHNELRCDYILYNKDKNLALFVELKGGDIKKAFKQIIDTNKKFGDQVHKKYVAIVYKSSIPRARDSIQNFKVQHVKTFLDFFIETDKIELDVKNETIVKK